MERTQKGTPFDAHSTAQAMVVTILAGYVPAHIAPRHMKARPLGMLIASASRCIMVDTNAETASDFCFGEIPRLSHGFQHLY
ncbi:hypothetical protein Vi05172_g4055 [Venturia inaequalis]|nr:hypothetical protein Vi05172_g4055 [Venturia inaequalis]